MGEILVGVDGSEACRRAVEFAIDVGKRRGFSLLIIHVIPWSPYSFNTPGENEYRKAQKENELAAATEQILAPMLQLAADAGVAAEPLVDHGDPVDLIVDTAEERDVWHIVVGRTGDSRIKRALFGSIPGHLMQVAPVPVTVVP